MQKNLQNQNELAQYLPKPYKKRRYYTPVDVSVHNTPNDCWISLFNEIFDLTELIQKNIHSPLCDPLIENAGKDVTFWFEKETKEPRKQIDLKTGLEIYYCPRGKYLHIPEDSSKNSIEVATPWWKNKDYFIGRLTRKTRKIKIINMLTVHEDIIEVPSEETINEILDRYKEINEHAASYTWKRLGRPLDMEKTLEENDIFDETDEFEILDIPEDQWYIPAIHLYFNDDLTVA